MPKSQGTDFIMTLFRVVAKSCNIIQLYMASPHAMSRKNEPEKVRLK